MPAWEEEAEEQEGDGEEKKRGFMCNPEGMRRLQTNGEEGCLE